MSDFDDQTMQAAVDAIDPEGDRNAPKVHVLRAQLPWRTDGGTTECGRDASTMEHVLTREQAGAKAKQWGQRRASLMFCMTCRDHSYSWMTWEQSPVAVVARECQRRSGGFGRLRDTDERARLDYELRALGLLVQAHREEFDATLASLGETTELAQRRATRARRR